MSGPVPGMRVLVDMHATQSTFFGERGVRRLALDYTAALAGLTTPPDVFALNPLLPAPGDLGEAVVTSGRLRWNTPAMQRSLLAEGELVYHHLSILDGTAPAVATIPPVATAAGTRLVVTVHDVIPYAEPEKEQVTEQARLFHEGRRPLFTRADLLLVNSRSTRDDLLRLFDVDPERVALIGGGVRPLYHPDRGLARARMLDLPGLRPGFVVTVAGWHARKNVEGLLAAWALLAAPLRRRHPLVVVCDVPPAGQAQWERHGRALGLGPDDVVFAGRVSDDDLVELYRQTDLFVFPSFSEGFGLPIAEAICAGAPVLTSDTSASPEVLDLPASTFPPGDPHAIAALVTRALTDTAFRTLLRTAGEQRTPELQWARAADRTVSAYRRLSTLPPVRPAGATPGRGPVTRSGGGGVGRHGIALAGPFAPAQSGIGIFNSRLAEPLAALTLVDRFAEGVTLAEMRTADRADGRETAGDAYPVTALGRTINPLDYDHRVYTLGNSPFHRDTARAAARYPGTVWLHDVSLIHLFLSMAAQDEGSADAATVLRTLVQRAYGDRLATTAGFDWAQAETYVRAGLRMAAVAVAEAEQIIVSSTLAAELLALDVGPLRTLPPVHVLPLAFPELPDRPPPGSRLLEPPLVVSLGHLNDSKAPLTLVDAVATIARETPVQLAFVGPYEEACRQRVLRRAGEVDIDGLVRVTGAVDDDSYLRWMRRGTVAVQLRTQTLGEASAAVCDAMSAGLPVLTNVASCRDLPAGVVVLLPAELDVDGVTSALRELISDPAAAAALGAAAAAHAGTWRHADLAGAVASLLPATA